MMTFWDIVNWMLWGLGVLTILGAVVLLVLSFILKDLGK